MKAVSSIELAALAKQTVRNKITAKGNSDIQKFYNKTTLFITGGTGFLGKQLIEKLLRACNITRIYVLLRPKKDMDSQTRLANLLQDTVYDTLRQEQPNFSIKIVAVDGDVSNKRLGINEEDRMTLTNEVDIFFHLAATTRFDESLKVATLINLRGTQEAIILAKACKKLRAFVHVSTAYSHASEKLINEEVDEKFYSSPIPPDTLISLVESLEEKRLISITSDLIRDWPNTYTFTKAVAEEAVRTMSHGLPICIVRPGIVIASYQEPSAGWVDFSCIYGASGLLTGITVGAVHTLLYRRDAQYGYIPCDYANNAIIVAGRETATYPAKGGDETKIYAVLCSARNFLPYEILADVLKEAWYKISSPSVIYYMFIIPTANIKIYKFLSFLLHTLPAYCFDFICFLLRRKPMFVKLCTKLHKTCDILSYFSLYEWKFIDHNLEKLSTNLKEDDKIIFNFDITNIDWKDYLFAWILGTRKYILKEDVKVTKYASKKKFLLKTIHYVVVTFFSYGIWKIGYLMFKMVKCLFAKRNLKFLLSCISH